MFFKAQMRCFIWVWFYKQCVAVLICIYCTLCIKSTPA